MESDTALTDLARRAASGDRSSLGGLLRELEPLVVRTARLVVGAGSWAAEDAAQEALLDVARGIRALRDPEAVRAWALQVTTTRALKVARRERLASLRRELTVDREVGVPSDERATALKDAFDRLPPAMRATAVLRLYVGLSESETAVALDCSVGTVKSNLHDARRRLASSLRERGLAPTVLRTATEEMA